METVLVRNWSYAKLILHLVAEYFVCCLRKQEIKELKYYMVLTPVQIGKG